jgi:hypothetical protein
MNRLYPLTALVGGILLLAWRVLRRKPKPVQHVEEQQVEYDGVIVAPTW